MSSKREVIAGPGVPAPLGPYSPAVRAGDLLFVSGQVGVDPVSSEPVGDSFDQQCRQTFANLDTVLQAGGSNLGLVVNVTALVADVASFGELNELFAEFFPVDPPARMTMEVPLPRGLLVSIGCVAAINS